MSCTIGVMPTRPREHELENESRMAFEQALGRSRVYRRLDPDYGVDGEVEEFDRETGRATGVRYWVQLKATDEADHRKALKLAISNEHADYYRSLQQPLLMVRYHAPARQLYARWFHQYDRYIDGGGRKSVTFRWRDVDAWDSKRPDELNAEAKAFVRLTSSRALFPMRLFLESRVADLDLSSVAMRLQSAAWRVRDILVPAFTRPPAAACVITVTSDSMNFDLARVTAATLHYPTDTSPARLPDDLIAYDALVLVALALERVGQALASSRLAELALPLSSMAGDERVAAALASEMSRARQIPAAISTFEALDSSGDEAERRAAFAFYLAAISHAPTMNAAEHDHLQAAVQRRVDRLCETDPSSVAVDVFNLADMERDRGNLDRALSLLDQAKQYDPSYESRQQWWTQRGVILFEAGRPCQAVDSFREAVRRGNDRLTQLQLVEALMSMGRYRDALNAVPDLSDSELEDPWVAQLIVVAGVLSVIVDDLAIETQERDPRAERDLHEECDRRFADGGHVPAEYLMQIIRRDALCGLAWLLLSSKETSGSSEDNRDHGLVLSWLSHADPNQWVHTIADFILHGPAHMVPALIICGDEMTDGQILPLLAHELVQDEPSDRLLAAAEATVIESRQRREGRLEVRIVESGEVFHVATSLAEPNPASI
jgi:tetratricopeptide (TPR) repeat protein